MKKHDAKVHICACVSTVRISLHKTIVPLLSICFLAATTAGGTVPTVRLAFGPGTLYCPALCKDAPPPSSSLKPNPVGGDGKV